MSTQFWLDTFDGEMSVRRHGPRRTLITAEAPLSRLTPDGAEALVAAARRLRSVVLSGSHFPTIALDATAANALAAAGGVEALTVNAAALEEAALVRLLEALGRLRTLDLAGTALRPAEVRAALARQPGLVDLRLGFAPPRRYEHRFTPALKGGEALEAVGALQSLESLSLRGLEVGDEVADLSNLEALRRLDLGETQVTSATLVALARAPGLRELRVDRTVVDDRGLAALADAGAIESLDVSDTRVTAVGLAALANQRRVRRLSLSGLPVSDAQASLFSGWVGLQAADLSRTRVGAHVVEALAAAPALESLDLPNVDAATACACAALSALRRLSLGIGNAPPWTDLARLEALDELAAPLGPDMQLPAGLRRLRGDSLDAQSAPRLADASRLEVLSLCSGGAALAGLPHGALPELREVSVGLDGLDDVALRRLLAAPAIEALYISNSPLTSVGLDALSDAPFLHTLELRGIPLNAATAQTIAALPRLHCLDVPGTGLGEAEIALLAAAPNLQSLALDPGQITARSMDALAAAPLSELYIYGSPFTTAELVHLAALRGLLELNVMEVALDEVLVEAVARLASLRVVRATFASLQAAARLAALRPDLRGFPGAGDAAAIPCRRA